MTNIVRFDDFADSGIRLTDDGRFSVLDVIKFCGKKNPSDAWKALSDQHSEVPQKVEDFKFPGRGQQFTPVANRKNILYIIGLLPGALSLTEFDLLSKVLGMDGNEQAQFLLRFPQKAKRPSRFGLEKDVQLSLQALIGGIVEVRTLAGNIDLLTADQIIEVKDVKAWKSALGQILVYGEYYPSHQKRIHLFGETQTSYLELIKSHCSTLNVIVTHQT